MFSKAPAASGVELLVCRWLGRQLKLVRWRNSLDSHLLDTVLIVHVLVM